MEKPTAILWPNRANTSNTTDISKRYMIRIMPMEEKSSTKECIITKMKPSLLKAYPNAFEILKQEATGHPNALWNQAVCFDIGIGTKQDLDLANAYYILSWVQKMLDNHEMSENFYKPNAVKKLALKPKTAECYKEAVNLSCPSATYQSALCYLNGVGRKKDYKLAVDLFSLACKLNVADAYAGLGDCYVEGHGVPKDFDTAIKYYREAANKGSPIGMCQLGIYYLGFNSYEAMYWLEKSANKGCEDAKQFLFD